MPSAFTIDDDPRGPTLSVRGPWTDAARKAMLRHGVDRLALNYARGFTGRDLGFLGELQGCVRELDVLMRTLKDISPIYSLGSTLEGLSMQTGAESVDLTLLPRLRYLAIDWSDVSNTIGGSTSLEELVVLGYDAPDLTALGGKPALVKLVLKPARRLESLLGAESLHSLESLQAKLAPKLHDLSAVAALGSQFREVEFEDCRALTDLHAMAPLVGLRFFGASDCGGIATLKPLENLTELEVVHLWGSTSILDGDLSPLAALPHLRELRMQDRRTYHPRVADIQRLLGRR